MFLLLLSRREAYREHYHILHFGDFSARNQFLPTTADDEKDTKRKRTSHVSKVGMVRSHDTQHVDDEAGSVTPNVAKKDLEK